jgi:nucleotide-binding universal stress UspA family protein
MTTQTPIPHIVLDPEPSARYSVPQFKKILVAVDRATDCTKIWERAMELAAPSGSCLAIFSCIQDRASNHPELIAVSSLGLYGSTYTRELIEQSERLRQEEIERTVKWLESLQQEAVDRGIPTEFHYQSGDAGVQICSYAKTWRADLILVGRRGRKGLSEMFLGSTSNYVLHRAPCSVLVVQ